MTTKTLRTRMLNLPGRMTTSGGRRTLHLARAWPWEDQFNTILNRLRAILGRSFAYAPDLCAMTASRHLCPTPADDGPPQPPSGPGLTRTLCRLNGSSHGRARPARTTTLASPDVLIRLGSGAR